MEAWRDPAILPEKPTIGGWGSLLDVGHSGPGKQVHYMTGLLAPDLKRDILGRLGWWIWGSMVQHSPSLYMALGSSPLREKRKTAK